MKRLLFVLTVISGIAYATDDCLDTAQKIVSILHKSNKNAIQLNYSSDNIAKATACKSAIIELDKAIVVKMKSISGSGVFITSPIGG
jgi:hypothetical protein